MQTPLIQFHGVGFSYPAGGRALEGVSFSVAPGEFVAVAGANGSGKSTLARLCNGLLLPSEGEATVAGVGLGPDAPQAGDASLWRLRQQVGLVFQHPDNQLVAATVEEDVAFGPENLGLPPAEIRRRVEGALRLVGLQTLRDRPPHRLSGGQKQLVAIAGVLAMEPQILILDEPTAMLDPRAAATVLEVVHRLHREKGLTVLWITHRMEEVARAQRVLVLSGGRLAADTTPTALFSGQAFPGDGDGGLARFGLELPDVALLAHRLRQRGLPLPPMAGTVEEMVEALWPFASAG